MLNCTCSTLLILAAGNFSYYIMKHEIWAAVRKIKSDKATSPMYQRNNFLYQFFSMKLGIDQAYKKVFL